MVDIKKLKKYDYSGFDINSKHIETNNEYDPNGFNIKGIHRDTNNEYDPHGFDIYQIHKDTDYMHDPNGFNIKGIHRDTGIFLNKENDIRKKISKNINWLNDKDKFLKLYDEIIKNGEFSVNTKNKSISSNIFKKCLEDILSGDIKDNEAKDYIKGINDIEKKLNKLKKDKKINELKNYIKKIKKSVYEKDNGRVRTDEAKSFEDQKGKGYVDLPISLSKLNINSSKELISDIKQLINNLYNNKQINNQVYNILNRSVTYKNDSQRSN